MDTLEAIRERHSVRKYIDKALADDVKARLEEEIEKINKESGLHVQLITGEYRAFKGPMAYGKFSGVSSYLVMAGPKEDGLDEKVGYYGEKLVLLAQCLGLNSCWAGVSYSKIAGTYHLEKGEKIACYIALGYGLNQGVQHKSKSLEELSNVSDSTPEWFRKGVEAAQLAPTAINQQKFFIKYVGGDEDVKGGADDGCASGDEDVNGSAGGCSNGDEDVNGGAGGCSNGDGKRKTLPKVRIEKGFSMVGYTQMDMGIAKLHFEIGAGRENFVWE